MKNYMMFKTYSNHIHLIIIIITFLITISIISSTIELSFAKIENEDKDNDDLKDISSSSRDENRKTVNDDLKEPNIENDIINGRYPDQFFVCGYPQQVISDPNNFAKINCK